MNETPLSIILSAACTACGLSRDVVARFIGRTPDAELENLTPDEAKSIARLLLENPKDARLIEWHVLEPDEDGCYDMPDIDEAEDVLVTTTAGFVFSEELTEVCVDDVWQTAFLDHDLSDLRAWAYYPKPYEETNE